MVSAASKKPIKNQIVNFFHCGECMVELRSGVAGKVSPQQYSRLECGWTKKGWQVWCIRHAMNVVHIDLKGQKVDYAN